MDVKAYRLTCNQLNKILLPRPVSFLLELVRWIQVWNRRSHELLHAVYTTPPSVHSTDAVNLSLCIMNAHYSELDAVYALNSQPSQCLYYVIIRIIRAGVSLFNYFNYFNYLILIN